MLDDSTQQADINSEQINCFISFLWGKGQVDITFQPGKRTGNRNGITSYN